MVGMLPIRLIGLWLAFWIGQADLPSAYVTEGDRVEQQFRLYRDNLERFFISLRGLVQREIPRLLPELELDGAPPEPGVYGYQLLPEIVDDPRTGNTERVSTFSYSWPITEGYIESEGSKLARVEADFQNVARAVTENAMRNFIREYRALVENQRTIDSYIQYNRFWQRSIALDRPRFDQLTRIYDVMLSGEPDAAGAVREALGRPEVPAFIEIDDASGNNVVLRVPVYTDIEDEAFLEQVEAVIEETWRVRDRGVRYAVEIQFRRVSPSELYDGVRVPRVGDHFEIPSHTARFPTDGAILTTGAESTHGFVGRYVALGSGDVSKRTLAHEFGHVLGFRDGYIRGYRDLAERGFEIIELTSVFDDIMSAPREGRVQPTHFQLILDAR